MDKRLPCFEVYGKSKKLINLIEMHHYATNTWCEQYIEQITNI